MEPPWEEEPISDEMEGIFLNKHVEECKVHAWEDEVHVLELSSVA